MRKEQKNKEKEAGIGPLFKEKVVMVCWLVRGLILSGYFNTKSAEKHCD